MFKEWILNDMDLELQPDEFCAAGKAAGVQIQRGWTLGWQLMKPTVLSKLNAVIASVRKLTQLTPKTVKLFITGHSLGAALAAVASYDLWCNPQLLDGGQTQIYGTIAFGQPLIFFGQKSVEFYKKIVPKERRMRVIACSHGSDNGKDVVSCDIIGSNFPDVFLPFVEGKGYLQPDDDCQVSWVRNDPHFLGGGCFGFPGAAACHMLDRYAQGLHLSDRYNNGICAKVLDPQDTKLLTPMPNGQGQDGFPDAPGHCM